MACGHRQIAFSEHRRRRTRRRRARRRKRRRRGRMWRWGGRWARAWNIDDAGGRIVVAPPVFQGELWISEQCFTTLRVASAFEVECGRTFRNIIEARLHSKVVRLLVACARWREKRDHQECSNPSNCEQVLHGTGWLSEPAFVVRITEVVPRRALGAATWDERRQPAALSADAVETGRSVGCEAAESALGLGRPDALVGHVEAGTAVEQRNVIQVWWIRWHCRLRGGWGYEGVRMCKERLFRAAKPAPGRHATAPTRRRCRSASAQRRGTNRCLDGLEYWGLP